VVDYDTGRYVKNFATLRKGFTVYIHLPKKGNKGRWDGGENFSKRKLEVRWSSSTFGGLWDLNIIKWTLNCGCAYANGFSFLAEGQKLMLQMTVCFFGPVENFYPFCVCKRRACRQFTAPRRRIFLCGNNAAVLMLVSVWILLDLPCYWLLNDPFVRSDYSHTHWEVSPVHAVISYRGSRGITPLILNCGNRWKLVVSFTPR
jgi:hypothetical protein